MSDPIFLVGIAASVADTAVININGSKTLVANDVSTFFINGKPFDVNGPRNWGISPALATIFFG